MNGENAAGAPSDSDSVAGTVPPTVPPADAAPSGTSNAWTSSLGVSKDTSAWPALASLANPAASSGIDTCCTPALTAVVTSRTTCPLWSGDHGGMPPSVSAHGVMPKSGTGSLARLQLVVHSWM